ncbi:conserved hypothetical protein [Ricinus communis]|uniref:Uncharacterized protein n=1 Tax=Ricinus communis TaxID=3988 RepID=B9SUR4_RICCO|nr:conserved hypothetical protein [Ricinus communis]
MRILGFLNDISLNKLESWKHKFLSCGGRELYGKILEEPRPLPKSLEPTSWDYLSKPKSLVGLESLRLSTSLTHPYGMHNWAIGHPRVRGTFLQLGRFLNLGLEN